MIRYISTDDGGVRKGKQELPAQTRRPEGNVHNETDEQPAHARIPMQLWRVRSSAEKMGGSRGSFEISPEGDRDSLHAC
jgi:hypothetical protein